MWNTEILWSLGIWAQNLGSAQSTREESSWSLPRVSPDCVHCVVWGWPKTSPCPLAKHKGLTQKREFGLSVCICSSAAQWVLSAGGTEPVQSWFLISALQEGYSETETELWRTRAFCGKGCSETSVSVPRFRSPRYVSSTDLMRDHCPFKRKTGEGRTCWSGIPAYMVLFLTALIFLDGRRAGSQHRDAVSYSIPLWRLKRFLLSSALSSISASRSCMPVVNFAVLISRAEHGSEAPDTHCSSMLLRDRGRVPWNNLWRPCALSEWIHWLHQGWNDGAAVVLAQLHVSWVSAGLHRAMQQARLQLPLLSPSLCQHWGRQAVL